MDSFLAFVPLDNECGKVSALRVQNYYYHHIFLFSLFPNCPFLSLQPLLCCGGGFIFSRTCGTFLPTVLEICRSGINPLHQSPMDEVKII